MATYAVALISALHQTVIDEFGAGAKFVLLNSGNTVLSTIALDNPIGTVDQLTGKLTIGFDGRDESAAVSGTAVNFQLRKSDDTPLITGPVRSGTTPLSGYLTLNSTVIVAGTPVEVSSLTFG